MPFQLLTNLLIGGALASNTKAGFLGAVIAAFIAGYIVKWGKEHIKLPDSMQQMMPLVILPFLATGAVAIIMGVILATPLASINDALVSWLRDMCSGGTFISFRSNDCFRYGWTNQ